MTGPGRGPEGIKKKWHDYFSCEKKQWLEGKSRQEPSIHPQGMEGGGTNPVKTKNWQIIIIIKVRKKRGRQSGRMLIPSPKA